MSDASLIEREAADWVVRQPLAPGQGEALEEWLRADPRHAGALLRAEAVWHLLDDVHQLQSHGGDEEAHIAQQALIGRRAAIGLAASIVAGVGVGGTLAVLDWTKWMTTGVGEIRRLPLADGSVATIDAQSELKVELAADERRVTLMRGQAWFKVERDTRRPFTVDAGLAEVRVLGTAFAVERSGEFVRVSVTEGTVAAWASEQEGAPQILTAGEYALFSPSSMPPHVASAPQEVERLLAWRNGEIALDGETLREAAERFNRYNRTKLVVENEALGNQRLVGLFRISDTEGFAQTAAGLLEAEIEYTGDTIRLMPKKPGLR